MIINIRGTSGSGKSTLVRNILASYQGGGQDREMIEKRRQPLSYLLRAAGLGPLRVLGHYETACGGCDTITDGYDRIWQLAREAHARGEHVLMEGLLLSTEHARTVQAVRDGLPVSVIQLDTDLETCIRRVGERRLARGDERPLNPANTEAKHKGIERVCERLRQDGVTVIKRDAYTASLEIVALLRENA